MEPETYTYLVLERRRNIMIVRFNRPDKKNALHMPLRLELMQMLDRLRSDPKIQAVILTGGPDYFCAGFDRDEIIGLKVDNIQSFSTHNKEFHIKFLEFPKLLIAAVNGYALGGGCDLSMLCHLRVASKSALFGHPEISFGATPLYCLYYESVGKTKALEFVLNTSDKERFIGAEEAARIGIINQIAQSPDALDDAIAMAKHIIESPPIAVSNILAVSRLMRNSVEKLTEEFDYITKTTEEYLKSLNKSLTKG